MKIIAEGEVHTSAIDTLPFACPVCGRKTEYPFGVLTEGAVITCPFCNLTLTLHGHMLEDVQKEIEKLKGKP